MRILLAIGLAFALGGCAVVAIPPAVTIASYAVDGVSYIATGKSLTDHAISEVAGEDCVLIRAAVLAHPCRDYVEPDSALAVELETNYGGEAVSTQLAEADLAAGGRLGGEPATAVAQRPEPTALASAHAARPAPASRYVVVGSFRDRGNAERARRAHAASGAAVVPASVRGRAVYRVIASDAASAGKNRWTIAPCAGRGAAQPCLDRASLALVRGEGSRRSRPAVESAALPAAGQLSDHSAARRVRHNPEAPGG